MAKMFRDFVGGPNDGEARAVDDNTMSVSLPITVRGKTLHPPRWGVYKLDGEVMRWAGDAASIGDALEIILPARSKGGA